MRLIVATGNQGKVKEIRRIFRELDFEIVSLKDIGFTDEIIEDGDSFIANALIKAKTIADIYSDSFVLADDSGINVDFLNGEPGIHSARYAGENSTQLDLINKLLTELKDVPFGERGAHFTCSMVLIDNKGSIHTSLGECYGKIAFGPRGINGFGYDPIFMPIEFQYSRTMAELPSDLKNSISHRGRALQGIHTIIKELTRDK